MFRAYAPIRVDQPWGKEVDYNLLHTPGETATKPAVKLQSQSGRDEHSVTGDALFVDPASGDYRVKPGSPALELGFQNFPMNEFGITSPRVKAIARTPRLPGATEAQPETLTSARDGRTWQWAGATVRNVIGFGEVSAAGLPGESGVLVLEAPAASSAARAGLRKNDVLTKLGSHAITTVDDLKRSWEPVPAGAARDITVFREQREQKLRIQK